MSNQDIDSVIGSLTPVNKNARYARQDCDILFNEDDGKNGKFKVSDSLFRRLNLNHNGFQLLVGNGEVYAAIVPNEEAVTYAGRPDSENKSKKFASTVMRETLEENDMDGEKFWLSYVGEKDGIEYYRVTDEEPQDSGQQVEQKEEAPVSNDVGSFEENATEDSSL